MLRGGLLGPPDRFTVVALAFHNEIKSWWLMESKGDSSEGAEDPLATLYSRPGFLLRRANQIAAALFLEAVAEYDITTTQYGALIVLRSRGAIDQISLARMLGLDRSTAGLVVANLERRGVITRTADPQDRRRRVLMMTAAGKDLLARVSAAAEGVPERELAMFDPAEAEQFLSFLARFVGAFNRSIRTPLHEDDGLRGPG